LKQGKILWKEVPFCGWIWGGAYRTSTAIRYSFLEIRQDILGGLSRWLVNISIRRTLRTKPEYNKVLSSIMTNNFAWSKNFSHPL
jgi:hypothetical protein